MIGDTARQRMARRARILLLLFGVAAAFLFRPEASNAYVACAPKDPGSQELWVQMAASSPFFSTDIAFVRRSAEGAIEASTDGSTWVPCGLNVFDTATIRVFVDPPGITTPTDQGPQVLVIDISQGHFSDGSPTEIEWDVDLGEGGEPSAVDRVIVKGGASDEQVALGTTSSLPRINLNANEATPDADVTLTDVEVLAVDMGSGNDIVTGMGGLGTGTPVGLPIRFAPGPGADQFTGGNGIDVFFMGTTADAGDTIVGGPAHSVNSADNNDEVRYRDYTAVNTTTGGEQAGTSGRAAAVRVTLDGLPNDGTGTENDNIDVEHVIAGAGADYLEGVSGPAASSIANLLDGDGGTDEVSYASRSTPVTVTLGDTATPTTLAAAHAAGNDGATGEGDIVHQVETITGGSGNDTLTGASSGTGITLNGNAGEDTLNGTDNAFQTGVDVLNGGDHDDVLNGRQGTDTLNGGSGDDELNGGDHDDTLNGGEGGDDMDGGNRSLDSLTGQPTGPGDAVSYANSTVDVVVTLDDNTDSDGEDTDNDGDADEGDTLTSIESLTGGQRDDYLRGDSSGNTIRGGPGDDVIDGNTGNDTLNGEAGSDTASYASIAASVTVDLDLTAQQNTAGGGMDTLSNLENLIGSAHTDTLSGDENANKIDGGGSGDTIEGKGGDDILDGQGGSDTLDFRESSSGVHVDLQAQTATGEGDDDVFDFELVIGTTHDDELEGTAGDDKLYGNSGSDVLNGRAGDDTLDGDLDPDPTVADSGTDVISYADAPEPTPGSGIGLTVDLTTPANNTGEAAGDTNTDSIEGVVGSAFDDTLNGTSQANLLSGLAGDDELIGNDGNDTLRGGSGNDTLRGGGHVDTADYSETSDDVEVNLAAPTGQTANSDGVEGIDKLFSIENATGGSGDDTLLGNLSDNVFKGGDGNDTLSGSTGSDTLQGGDGNDVLLPGGGVDSSVDGGAGDDTVDYSNSTGQIRASLTTNSGGIDGNTGDADTYVDNTIENITGSPQNDNLTGDENANRLAGLAGADTLDGMAGSDTADYSAASGVVADLGTPANNTGHAAGDTYTAVENLLGSPGDDTIAGNGSDNVLTGGLGTDTVSYAGAGAGVTASLSITAAQNTGAGNDTLSGFENLTGSGHADTLSGNTGNNVLKGGAGTDTLSYANAGSGVTVDLELTAAQNTVGAGTDAVEAFENLTGSSHADTLLGTDGDNTITGGTGTDTVSYANAGSPVSVDLRITAAQPTGGSGSDTISGVENVTGSPADDTLAGDGSNNVIDGGAGTDVVTYEAATAGVTATLGGTATGDGTDTISNVENLTGSPQGDTLVGNAGANAINGGDGDDTIDGRGGNDTENGGAGDDTFYQGSSSNGADVMSGGAHTDEDIVDYSDRSNPVSVTFDGAANDGESGEGDNVGTDVEDTVGPSTPPGAPTNVRATAGKALVTVTWSPPLSNGGNPITGYTVTSTPDGKTATAGGNTLSATVVGLRNGVTYTFTVTASNIAGTGAVSAPSNAVTPSDPTAGQGYALLGDDGGVFSFGAAGNFGSIPGLGITLNKPPIGLAYTPTGNGYWIVAEDGGIFTFGDAKFHGSMGGAKLNAPVLGMEPTPTGGGYWLFAADGGIFSFGDATFHGSMGGTKLNAPVVGMAATSTGGGYWLVAQDGGIFSFGDATFHGSMGGTQLNQPVFDMAPTADNGGYWLVARDGGIFSFGNAKFLGSAAPANPATVIGIGTTPAGNGYWIADRNGVVYAFGDGGALGDLRGLGKTAVSFAALPAKK